MCLKGELGIHPSLSDLISVKLPTSIEPIGTGSALRFSQSMADLEPWTSTKFLSFTTPSTHTLTTKLSDWGSHLSLSAQPHIIVRNPPRTHLPPESAQFYEDLEVSAQLNILTKRVDTGTHSQTHPLNLAYCGIAQSLQSNIDIHLLTDALSGGTRQCLDWRALLNTPCAY